METLTKGIGMALALSASLWLGLSFAFMWPPIMQRAPTRTSCLSNLRQLDAGKDQWAVEAGMKVGDPSDDDAVNEYIKGGRPTCWAGGTYYYNPVASDPTCSLEGTVDVVYASSNVPRRKVRVSLFRYRVEPSYGPHPHALP